MKKYLWGIIAVIIVVILIIGYYSESTKTSKNEEIKIGLVLPITGFGAYWGESSLAGAQLAASDLKVEGYNVQIIAEDSAGEPAKAASAAQKLISINSVQALYADFSGPSSAVSPIAKDKEIPFVYNTFASGISASNPYALKTFFSVATECQNFADYAKSKGIKKVAYTGPQLEFVPECTDVLKREFGDKNVIVETVANPSINDYRSSLIKIQDFGAEFITMFAYEANFTSVYKQKSELGIDIPIHCIQTDCMSDKQIAEIGIEAYENSLIFDFEVPNEFKNRLDATTNPRAAAVSYDAVQYLVRAIAECEKGEASCITQAVVENEDYDSAIAGNGFSTDRAFDLESFYGVIEGGKFVPVGL